MKSKIKNKKQNTDNKIKTDPVYEKDQFFTKPEIAQLCLSEVKSLYKLEDFNHIVETSGGNGDFFYLLPIDKRIGVEIDEALCQKNPEYICSDFFKYTIDRVNKRILSIGNPPFGTQNSLSVDFFNHAAKFSDVIAFLVPRTWNKTSIHNRLDKRFSLIKSIDLPENCFYGEKKTSVKCCFQIWERSSIERVKDKKRIVHNDWIFLPYVKGKEDLLPPEEADFVVLAYGSNPGQVSTNLDQWRPKSVHFILSNIDRKELMNRFRTLDYSCANNSARQSSLCKADLVRLYIERYGI